VDPARKEAALAESEQAVELSSLKGAVLGALLERPSHGYELAHRLGVRLGAGWQISPPHVYPVLDQLERVGLVRRVIEPNPERPRQPRTVYYPTERAAQELSRWLGAPPRREPLRAELQAKIAASRPEDAPALLAMLEDYQRECVRLLEAGDEVTPPARSWTTLLIALTREAHEAHLHAELEWLGMARRRIAEYVARSSVG
jgi:DNA-binding PadR family transcriptional regulator